MVSKIDLGILAIAGLAVFLIIRGAGQGLTSFFAQADPLGIKGAQEGLGGVGADIGGFFSGVGTGLGEFFGNLIPPAAAAPLTEEQQFDFSGLVGGVSPEPTGETPDPFRDAARFAADFPEIITGPFATDPMVIQEDFAAPIADPFQSQLNIGQEQPFTEAPLGALSLSAIIEKFMVTASQAANIKFIAQQGGDPFADPSNIFGENPPAVSDPQFQGLTPEQIFAQLVGGNISNF